MIQYRCLAYNDLNLDELYGIMRLRQEVFVVEQDCPYLDADGKDQASLHVLGEDVKGHLLSYARICPPGISYKSYSSIGRVIVDIKIRDQGEGYRLMDYALSQCMMAFPGISNKISAQSHLQNFYSKLGYKSTGEEYLEDGIPHVGMIR